MRLTAKQVEEYLQDAQSQDKCDEEGTEPAQIIALSKELLKAWYVLKNIAEGKYSTYNDFGWDDESASEACDALPEDMK